MEASLISCKYEMIKENRKLKICWTVFETNPLLFMSTCRKTSSILSFSSTFSASLLMGVQPSSTKLWTISWQLFFKLHKKRLKTHRKLLQAYFISSVFLQYWIISYSNFQLSVIGGNDLQVMNNFLYWNIALWSFTFYFFK